MEIATAMPAWDMNFKLVVSIVNAMVFFFPSSSFHPLARDKAQRRVKYIKHRPVFFLFICFYRGTAGMSGPVEGRLAALPDGPFTAPRRHQ